jgi:hypothetical protein
MKRNARASLRAQEHRLRFAHARFKLRFHAGFHFDLCNFGDHEKLLVLDSTPPSRMKPTTPCSDP